MDGECGPAAAGRKRRSDGPFGGGPSPWRRSRPSRVSRTYRPSGTWSSRPGAARRSRSAWRCRRLMCRYAGAVHRYLLKALKDPDAAEELDQEFAVRFLRGDFRHGDPSRGRFRDYVKRAVQNLMKDYYRRRRRDGAAPIVPGVDEPSALDEGLAQFDRQFLQSWRNDLLDRAWDSLDELERTTGQPHYTILRLRVDEPGLTSNGLGGPALRDARAPDHPRRLPPGAAARRREFAPRLIAEVRASLEEPTRPGARAGAGRPRAPGILPALPEAGGVRASHSPSRWEGLREGEALSKPVSVPARRSLPASRDMDGLGRPSACLSGGRASRRAGTWMRLGRRLALCSHGRGRRRAGSPGGSPSLPLAWPSPRAGSPGGSPHCYAYLSSGITNGSVGCKTRNGNDMEVTP